MICFYYFYVLIIICRIEYKDQVAIFTLVLYKGMIEI